MFLKNSFNEQNFGNFTVVNFWRRHLQWQWQWQCLVHKETMRSALKSPVELQLGLWSWKVIWKVNVACSPLAWWPVRCHRTRRPTVPGLAAPRPVSVHAGSPASHWAAAAARGCSLGNPPRSPPSPSLSFWTLPHPLCHSFHCWNVKRKHTCSSSKPPMYAVLVLLFRCYWSTVFIVLFLRFSVCYIVKHPWTAL